MNGIIGKICTNPKCPEKGKKQPYENFYKNRGYRDGHQGECKVCLSNRSKAHDKKKKEEYNGFFNLFM